jgi:8-oxo-dGTP diphosphatase
LLVVVRSDTGRIALPGGHLDPGETPEQAAERELFEETGISVAFSSSHEVYRGPSRDPRDADHAWYVTAAFHQHLLPGHPAGTAELVASDESRSVAWMPLNDQLFDDLYAGHGAIVAGALARPTA